VSFVVSVIGWWSSLFLLVWYIVVLRWSSYYKIVRQSGFSGSGLHSSQEYSLMPGTSPYLCWNVPCWFKGSWRHYCTLDLIWERIITHRRLAFWAIASPTTRSYAIFQLVIINLPDERTHFFVVVLFTLWNISMMFVWWRS
jgi:hypothetical protein